MSDIPGIDTTVANVARIYDYLLGGKDNFEADRAAAAKIMELIPGSAEACRLNREFLVRVVTHLAGQGIRQFLDLGSGLPTRLNVHQIARHADRDARVVYVDYDRVAVLHAQAILNDGGWVDAIEGDIRDPAGIIAKAAGTRLINFREPVGVLMFAILHFIPDDDNPRADHPRVHRRSPPAVVPRAVACDRRRGEPRDIGGGTAGLQGSVRCGDTPDP